MEASDRKWSDDVRVLWHLLFSPVRGETHAERLESFYGHQADGYDSFRSRMLHGRRGLMKGIDFPDDGIWVDLGAGTGQNVFYASEDARSLKQIHLVDLSTSLLQVARRRTSDAGFSNVHTHLADVTRFDLPADSVDVVTFSYSLTMIPDWFAAIDQAARMLKPGGLIAVTDFYVSRKYPTEPQRRHGWMRRAFWTHWFAADNVFLSGDHLAMLQRRFKVERLEERFGKMPYLPFLKAPYYQLWARKRSN